MYFICYRKQNSSKFSRLLMDTLSSMLIIIANLLLFSRFCNTANTLTLSQSIRDGGTRTLVSKDGSFELGFFSPGSSRNRYVGIWYKNIPVRTVVWVANRNNPINDSSGFLILDNTGNFVLVRNNNSTVVWSSNSKKAAQSAMGELLDSGNLVLRDGKDANSGIYLWQSFDYPSDTLLPGMKLGWDLRIGLDRRLSAWKSPDDPSSGDFTWGAQLQSNPELVMWKGSKKYYRSGPWNGIGFSGGPELRINPVFYFDFVDDGEEVYYTYNLKNKSLITRIVMNQTTYFRQRYTWNEINQTWVLYATVPRDYCDTYNLCGAYGNCIISQSPVCQCLEKFTPKSPESWNSMDWSEGCVRNKPLDCQKGDGFIKYVGLKLPDATNSWVNKTMNLKECRSKCLQNCSCMAYTATNIKERSGCAIWFGDLMDIKQFPAAGQEIYIRMNASESKPKVASKIRMAVGSALSMFGACGILLVAYYIFKRKAKLIGGSREENDQIDSGPKEDLELPLFQFTTIAKATNGFSFNNKIGEGGFGPVYKGTLEDGREIAAKTLSRSSGQGINEFKNEVILITKLQHRNLVKLLGCSIQGEEKILVYEYMPNKSLDSFIFDQTRGKLLDWSKRFSIICGIARGLLYLHQDSRLRIVHRDLKASNVLLDKDMKPKISDFGLARMFGGDQTEGNTTRVVGTYGYMAPEYATDGLFSVKSDVFSFGILMLEIISGKKSRGFYHPHHSLSLIGHAWRLWKDGKPLNLIEAFPGESCNLSEVIMRCINISLLCVQQHPDDRPSMATVVWMLGGENTLPQPKEPGFFKGSGPFGPSSSSSNIELSSNNEFTASLLYPR
ncbi:PREDICTED: G-type lectin S-receptor-like serine/threonine-protein kinase At4g27290 [Populus euphratica]|uniref:Receptor-like serine/threonine-protein kinase n=1 Tax=Populus euphratica TaxID=75702 RepID=A0AAJ6TP48_POPEU|nr:PREDICTED: G-type lectin S-receptor-like serine/threonine-protein kinase At4g27290 [Populus euphratica]